jgi:RHS repeat-associated protein
MDRLLAARALPSPRTHWGNRRPLRRRASGRSYYYVHTDQLNAPRKVAQPTTGTLAWRWDTDPFGTAAPNQNPAGLGTFAYNLRFPGQYYDAETGLSQNWNRDYDPIVGRYVESDPIGLTGGLNTYVYVTGDPIDLVDPFGLLTCTYDIAANELNCTNNAGQSMSLAGSYVKSGLGPCQNNPNCTAVRDEGPLPVGNYRIHPPGVSHKHPAWLYLQPSKQNNMQDTAGVDRNGFYIHPWGISNGCIAIYFNADFQTLSSWAVQDGGGDLHVSK